MSALLLQGKAPADVILREVSECLLQRPTKPSLAIIQLGHNEASTIYIRKKLSMAQKLGIDVRLVHLSEEISKDELRAQIDKLNTDLSVHGILLQLPLPEHLVEGLCINFIYPPKDVDGISNANLGLLCQGQEVWAPCTAAGILELLRYYQIPIEGRHVVIVGRSLIVGKPLALLCLKKQKEYGNATVTLCHHSTKNLEQITRTADILVVATGKPSWVKAHMIKDQAVVIDVGINRGIQPPSTIVGDVDFNSVQTKASAISPVPGGVGLMTIALLFQNLLKAFEKQMI